MPTGDYEQDGNVQVVLDICAAYINQLEISFLQPAPPTTDANGESRMGNTLGLLVAMAFFILQALCLSQLCQSLFRNIYQINEGMKYSKFPTHLQITFRLITYWAICRIYANCDWVTAPRRWVAITKWDATNWLSGIFYTWPRDSVSATSCGSSGEDRLLHKSAFCNSFEFQPAQHEVNAISVTIPGSQFG